MDLVQYCMDGMEGCLRIEVLAAWRRRGVVAWDWEWEWTCKTLGRCCRAGFFEWNRGVILGVGNGMGVSYLT